MSRISDIDKTFSNMPDIIEAYETAFVDIEKHLKLSGKQLDKALNEQAAWPIYYAKLRAELKSLVKFMDAKVAAARGVQARKYIENYSRTLGDRAMNSYIDADQEYLSVHQIYLEVMELYEKYDAAVDAFDKRGFALRDLTAARIAAVNEVVL